MAWGNPRGKFFYIILTKRGIEIADLHFLYWVRLSGSYQNHQRPVNKPQMWSSLLFQSNSSLVWWSYLNFLTAPMLLTQLIFSPLISSHHQGSFYFVLLNIIFLKLLEQYKMPEFQELIRNMVILNLSQQINSPLIIYDILSFSIKDSKRCIGCVMFDIWQQLLPLSRRKTQSY